MYLLKFELKVKKQHSIVLISLLLAGNVYAQPAQKPLLNRDGGGVSPNLVLTLDTSRSMDFQHAPEYSFQVKTGASSTKTVTFPNFNHVWMHPYDPGPGYYDGNSFSGIVPANPYRPNSTAEQMVWQMQMRSPDLNTLYYNPERKYDAWIKADGSRMDASPPTAAPFIPMLPMTGLTRTSPDQPLGNTNLTNSPITVAVNTRAWGLPTNGLATVAVQVATTRNQYVKWCYTMAQADSNSATSACLSSNAEQYYPMIYYRLKKNGSYFLDPTDYRNYSYVDINSMKTGLQMSGSASTPSATGTWTSEATLTNFPKTSARTDCKTVTDACTRAEERQNFANWFTYYRSRILMAQGAIPEAFKDIEDNKVRLGWGRIHQSSGKAIDQASGTTKILDRGVRDFGGTAANSTRGLFISWLRNHPGNTDSANGTNYETLGGTPLLASVVGVGEYYKRADNGGPWSDDPGASSTAAHKTCRRAYNMLVTDGYYSDDSTIAVGNSDGTAGTEISGPAQSYTYSPTAPYKDSASNTLADVAMEYWKTDLRKALGTELDNKVVATADDPAFWQHMNNYMVGLGVNGTLDQSAGYPASWPTATGAGRIDDLWHAAINSRGKYYSVKDPKDLTEGIQDALGQALKRELKESGVATASATLQDGNRKYIPFYKTGDWNGDIQTYSLDANGQAGPLVWAAASKLPAPASRSIWTWNTDTSPASAVPFTWATMGSANQTALGTAMGATYSASGVTYHTLVDFLRGDRSKEGEGQPFRTRVSPLGDFVNSNPVLVKDSVNLGYGSLPAGGSLYSAYLTFKKNRTSALLFAGGNDGMLHAFKDSLSSPALSTDGAEVFAYVPKAVYPNLYKLSEQNYGTSENYHQFFVDGSLMETDAYVNAPGAGSPSWRNYVVGSLGAGGRAVFALDVTDSPNINNANTVRWELNSSTNSDLGYVTGPIQVGVLPNGEWVAIFGNGSFSGAGKATLFVVNLKTGAEQTLHVETSTGTNGLGGVGVVRNTSGEITTLYAGDLKGKLWKFDYSAAAASRFEISGGTALFAAASTQSITQPPLIYDHSKGGKIVVFGTGKLMTEVDANNTDAQAIYGVWDKSGDTVARPMTSAVLQSRSLSSVAGAGGAVFYSLSGVAVNWDATSPPQRGWMIDLNVVSGMRVVYPPQAASKKLALFSVVSPARSLVPCEAAVGSGANLLIPVETGLNPTYPLFNVNGDTVINSSDTIVAGYATNADGIDAVVKGATDCSSGTCKTVISIQNTTSQINATLQEAGGTRAIKDRIWRRVVNPPIQ